MIVIAILVLGLLIFVHELGHFLLAKWNNVGVLEFSVGFGKKVWKHKRGETTYSIGIIPLGGYVRMAGDDPRELEYYSHQNGPGKAPPEDILQPISSYDPALLEDKSRWFLNQRFLAKSSIVLAGPTFNFLFAILLSWASYYHYGRPVMTLDEPRIGGIVPDSPAAKAGLRELDLVVNIDGKRVEDWEQISNIIATSGGREMVFLVEREEAGTPVKREIKVTGTTESETLDLLEGQPVPRRFRIGIAAHAGRSEEVGFAEAGRLGVLQVYQISRLTLLGIKGMLYGAVSTKHISGPIEIINQVSQHARRGFEKLVDFMVLLSVSLAVLNLLPIPILDGGHLMFFIVEAIKGSPISLRVQEIANQVGMFILMMLMVFAFGNDIMKFF